MTRPMGETRASKILPRDEPRKGTVGSALRALEARMRSLEDERARHASHREATDAVANALCDVATAVRELALREETRERERAGWREAMTVVGRRCAEAEARAEASARDAARARETALVVDARVTECVKYVRDVRDEVVGLERAAREAREAMGELRERDETRERALDALETRAREADALLREELVEVQNAMTAVSSAMEKANEIGNLAKDVRELAKWSRETAVHQNRRLAALERSEQSGSSGSGGQRLKELAASVQATASALKAQHARLNAMEERALLSSRRDAAARADVDVCKRALGEHHDILSKMCETFATELDVDVASCAPASTAFARSRP